MKPNAPARAIALTIGLATLACGGQQEQAAGPRTGSEEGTVAKEELATGAANDAPDEPLDPEPPRASDLEPKAQVAQENEEGPTECRESAAKLTLGVDRQSVSLEQGVLEATMDGPICSIKMTITRKGGLPTIEKNFRYTTHRRELRWDPIPRDQIEKIELRISADGGAFQAVLLVPWTATIDHEEVVFDTDKAVIRASEVASLEDSFKKIEEVLASVEGKGLGAITLFIAGHTDTRGSEQRNLDLSKRRARAIASWFVKRGLCIPIAFEGFGETALRKITADEVDAQENRRVDYILAVEPPVIRKGAKPNWKWVSKGC